MVKFRMLRDSLPATCLKTVWVSMLQNMVSSEMKEDQGDQASAVERYLAQVVERCGEDTSGRMAEELSAPGATDPGLHALALVTSEGRGYSAGDDEHLFTIQSISKPFVYALAIEDIGLDRVQKFVGTEPSGEAFNELSLEGGTGRPLNAMINAGAIVTHQLVDARKRTPRQDESELPPQQPRRTEETTKRTARVLEGLSAFAGRDLHIDWELAEAEYRNGYRNLAIAHMLKTHQVLDAEPDETVGGYAEQSSVLVTVQDIARMAATLANNGLHPETRHRVISENTARHTLSVMATCGMYDGSGRWLARIGIPAKSGISGGIIGVLPGQVGLASFAPRLNEEGNSVQGVEMFDQLGTDLEIHLMASQRHNITEHLTRYGPHPGNQSPTSVGDARGQEQARHRLLPRPASSS